MSVKNYKCPHCSAINKVDVKSFDEKFAENLPGGLAKGFVAVVATAANPLAGAAVATAFAADAVHKYLNGTVVTCHDCGDEFKI